MIRCTLIRPANQIPAFVMRQEFIGECDHPFGNDPNMFLFCDMKPSFDVWCMYILNFWNP